MYKLAIGVTFGVLLSSTAAMATCPAMVSFANGSTANADVVMGNFNTLSDCLNASAISFTGMVGIGATPSTLLTVGDGAAAAGYTLTLNGGTNSGKGVQIAFQKGGSNKSWIGTESYIQGGSSDDLTLAGNGSNNIRFYSGSNQIMHIASIGRVGIKTTAPSYDLHVAGTAGKPGGGSWTDSSDRRLKRDVSAIDGSAALVKLNQLSPVTFKWINPQIHGGEQSPGGFVAQQFAKVFPEFVHTASCQGADCSLVGGQNSDVYNLSLPFKFDAYMVAGIQELSKRVDTLSAKQVALSSSTVAAKDFRPVGYQEKSLSSAELAAALKALKTANDSQTAEIAQLEAQVTTLQRKLGVQSAQR